MASPGGPRSASPAIMEDIDLLNGLDFNNYPMDLADTATAPTTTAKLFASNVGPLPQNHHQGMSPPDSDPESSTESTSPSNSGAGTRQSPSGTPPQKAEDADSMTLDTLDDSQLDWDQAPYMFGQQNSGKIHDHNMMGDDMFDFSAFESGANTASQNPASLAASHPAMFQAQPTSQKRSRPQETSVPVANSTSPANFYGSSLGNIGSMQWIPDQPMGFSVPPAQFPMGLIPMTGMPVPGFQQQPQQRSSPTPPKNQKQQSSSPSQLPTSGRFPYELIIHPAPNKSRVETQLNLVVSIDRLPEKVSTLHLPTHCISKPKLLAKPPHNPDEESLELYCMVVCTSVVRNMDILRKVLVRAATSGHPEIRDPNTVYSEDDENHPRNGGEVHICSGCIQRERKRAARKKIKNVEDDELWSTNETRRIVVFNTYELIDWTKMEEPEHQGRWQAIVPMRIACYCRHHGEKEGFRVIMTLKDHLGNVLAQTMTDNIMITDDHKTHPVEVNYPNKAALRAAAARARARQSRPRQPTGSSRKSIAGPSGGKNRPRRGSDSSPDSKPVANEDPEEPMTKRRKSSGSPKVPHSMAMTPLDTPQAPAAPAVSTSVAVSSVPVPTIPVSVPSAAVIPGAPMSAPISTHQSSVSPFTPAMQLPYRADGLGSPVQGLAMHGLSVHSPINDPSLFSPESQPVVLDPLAMIPFNSTPSSARQSRDPSPGIMQTPRQSISTAHGMMSTRSPAAPQPTHPYIQKVVPAEGSKCGGSEVTVLGVGFRPGMRVMFGDRESTTTNFWGENTLLCRSPPSGSAGVVRVTVAPEAGSQVPYPQNPQAIFKYLDDDGEQLIRMALTILNHKMNGKMEDADSVARRVFNSAGSGLESSDNGTRHGGVSYNRAAMGETEVMIMTCLERIDLCTTMHVPQFDLKNNSGQTMLHLASSLGFDRVVAGLLARGANPNARDKAGYTPLHLASLNSHVEIVRRLIINRADVMIKSAIGYLASELTTDDDVSEVLSPYSQLRRSVSNHNLSRVSSEESLESLPAMLMAHNNGSSKSLADISPEYSSFEDDEQDASSLDLEDEDEEGDEQEDVPETDSVEPVRRRSVKDHHRSGTPAPEDRVLQDPGSPGVAAQLAAQLQQLQQTMSEHMPTLMQFRNLSHLANITNLPQIPGFPADYQAMRRLGQYLSGQRPEAAGEGDNAQSAGNARGSSEAPPAYDDIFPGSDSKAPRSAEEAAARLAALQDSKDALAAQEGQEQQEDEVETVEQQGSSADVDGEEGDVVGEVSKDSDFLTIGPKNKITKEQQMSFLRVYHAKNTGLGADRNLWLVWIPLLVLMSFAIFATTYPHTVVRLWVAALDYFGVPQDSLARDLGRPVANMLTLTKLTDVLGTAVAAATSSQATQAQAEAVVEAAADVLNHPAVPLAV